MKRIAFYVFMALVTLGCSTVFGWTIPGVTVPFDPPDYYSPDSISYPDSAPSIFTMRDLAANGFQVRDVHLNQKSIVENIKTLLEMVNQTTKIDNQNKNLTPLSANDLAAHYTVIDNALKSTSDTVDNYSGLMAMTDQAIYNAFRSTERFDYPNTSPVYEIEQERVAVKVLEATYQDAMNTAKIAGDQQAEIKAVEDALARLQGVSGNLDNEQIKGQIESIRVELLIKRNLLLSSLTALKVVEGKARVNQELKDTRDTREGAAFGVYDPYHPTPYEQRILESKPRPTGQGFIDF